VLVPAFAHGVLAGMAEPIPLANKRSGAGLVLDLPGPGLDRVRAPDTDRHFGVVAEVDQLLGWLMPSAPPALRRARLRCLLQSGPHGRRDSVLRQAAFIEWRHSTDHGGPTRYVVAVQPRSKQSPVRDGWERGVNSDTFAGTVRMALAGQLVRLRLGGRR
jgi:hypothetical protein